MSDGLQPTWDYTLLCVFTTFYNIFIASTLSFVAQFFSPSDAVLSAEASAIAKLLPGPTSWLPPFVAFRLKDWWKFPCSARSVQHVSRAARMRILWGEQHDKDSRIQSLADAFLQSNSRVVEWHAWYFDSISHHLSAAQAESAAFGMTLPTLSARILTKHGNSSKQPRAVVKRHLQAFAYT